MKIRAGFVSNSSSSSFVVVSAGKKVLYEDGNSDLEWCGSFSVNIDEMIAALTAAKAEGATEVTFAHGGGYDG